MTDKEHKWDQQLGDKLRNFRPEYRPESWDALSDRLADEEADLVTPADALVAAAIEKIQPEYASDSWDTLAARLDAEEGAFDQQVAAAMDNIKPRYRAGSWAALAALLELEAYRRVSVWQTKSLELTTAFVLLLAFWVFFPYFTAPTAPATEPQPLVAGKVLFPPGSESFAWTDSRARENDALPAAPLRANAEKNRRGSQVPLANSLGWANPSTPSEASAPPVTNAGQPHTTQKIDLLPPTSGTTLHAADPPTRLLATLAPDSEITAPLAVTEVNPPAPIESPPRIDRKLQKTKSPLVHTWGLIGTHWDQNVVYTPSFTLSRTFAAETRLSRGRTIGVTYALGRERHRWETGLLYRMKQYFPPYVVLTEERERTLNRMRYHSVSIPLSYQPTVARVGRWSGYLSIGASFNATLRAHITIEDIYRNSLQDPAAPRSEDERRAENFGEHQGLLQGGKFSNNATVYTLLGAGIEYRFPSGLSLFVQPTATRRIIDFGSDGEGPLLERINSNSILFGFKREF